MVFWGLISFQSACESVGFLIDYVDQLSYLFSLFLSDPPQSEFHPFFLLFFGGILYIFHLLIDGFSGNLVLVDLISVTESLATMYKPDIVYVCWMVFTINLVLITNAIHSLQLHYCIR